MTGSSEISLCLINLSQVVKSFSQELNCCDRYSHRNQTHDLNSNCMLNHSNIWWDCRDVFVLKEDGYGQFLSRIKDVIVKVGDKIFPVELEEFFLNHPDVLEAVVSQE